MYHNKNSILIVCLSLSLILLWCNVQPAAADSNEEEHQLIEDSDDDTSSEDVFELYRRASLRPVVLQQRASLRPFTGKRASLRPFAGKRASLRPFAGKRASLRPASFINARKRRSVVLFDE